MAIYAESPTGDRIPVYLGKIQMLGGGGIPYEAGEGIVIDGGQIRVKVPVIPLTRAEFDALPEEERQKEALYVIPEETDEEGGGSGGGSGGVSSFNGRTGAVSPKAGDYTADMVGARPNTWTPTAAEVGALPDGTAIPAKTSDLTNDSGFATTADIDAAIQAAILDSWEASY